MVVDILIMNWGGGSLTQVPRGFTQSLGEKEQAEETVGWAGGLGGGGEVWMWWREVGCSGGGGGDGGEEGMIRRRWLRWGSGVGCCGGGMTVLTLF